MVKDGKKARTREKANKRKSSGVFPLYLKEVFKRAFFRFSKSRPVRVAVILSIIIIIGALFSYMLIKNRKITYLNEPRRYIPWRQYKKTQEELRKTKRENEEVKSARHEDNKLKDSLHEVSKELHNNRYIYLIPPKNHKNSVELNMHIQRILHNCREFNGPIDGNPNETCKAVLDFQEKYRLEKIDAIIGPETWTTIIVRLEEARGEPGSLASYAYPDLR